MTVLGTSANKRSGLPSTRFLVEGAKEEAQTYWIGLVTKEMNLRKFILNKLEAESLVPSTRKHLIATQSGLSHKEIQLVGRDAFKNTRFSCSKGQSREQVG